MPKADFVYADPSNTTEVIGATPYGIYDKDISFQSESLSVCKFVARRLGHPVMQLEIDSGSMYAMFEEAVSEYSTHINNYNLRNWMWEQYGTENKISGSGWGNDSNSATMGTGSFQTVHPGNMGTTFVLSEQYGEAVNIGGDLQLYTGSLTITSSKQVYNLESASLEKSGQRIEIQRVFNDGPASISRFYDPFAGSFDQQSMLDNFGMGSASPAVAFIMRPTSYDVSRAQAIETSDKIRKSAYSFELVDNKLRLFPIPQSGSAGDKVWFQYYLRDDRSVTREYTENKVSDPSNAPYKFLTFNEINSNGRQWIRKYALALSKELLGIVRSKYSSMPLPNGDVNLDGEALKAEGREEKTQLLDDLKEFLEAVSLTNRAREEQEQAESNQAVLNKAPMKIYIG